MTESREPSYYEIALTNRQVVVAFVILLVCLLSAFFSGVWIGRESTARAQEQIASGTPPPEVKKEGQSVEDLEFFDARKDVRKDKSQPQRDETPASAPTAATAATDTTLAQDLAGKGSAPAPAPEPQEPPSRAAAVPSPAPIPVAPTPEPGRKGKGRNRDRLAEAAATPAATPGATRPARASDIAETAIPKGSSVIQVFSSQDRSQADAIRKRLVKGGQQAYLSPVDVAGHTMYRVRIGPFSSRPDAQKVAEKVRKAYKLDTWVTE